MSERPIDRLVDHLRQTATLRPSGWGHRSQDAEAAYVEAQAAAAHSAAYFAGLCPCGETEKPDRPCRCEP